MKSKLWFALGAFLIGVGASWIHPGLGLIILGAWAILISYIESDDYKNDEL